MRFPRLLMIGVMLVVSLRLAAAEADKMVVLANAADPDSVRLARHYQEVRQLAPDSVIALPMPVKETITWTEFLATIYNPLQAELANRGWLDATKTELFDGLGRRKYLIAGHRIRYLVTCRGVPLRIDNDPALAKENLPMTAVAQFRTNAGAVDSELTLLAVSGYPINAYVANPLFRRERPSFIDLEKVVKVTRLDGPTYADAAGLVDRAVAAEKTGLIGRAYVDIGGIYPAGDAWFEATAKLLDELGYDLSVDRAPTTFPATARFDAPVLYFGWYSGQICGPMARLDFRFPPGAIALHLHSFSATSMRSATEGWAGPLVAHGVTATFGNVFEPYLDLTQRPTELVQALATGATFGDAAYYSLPALSWETIIVGDPLYRPMAISATQQWVKRAQVGEDEYPYLAMRMVRLLERGGNLDEAEKMADEELAAHPSLPLAIKRARMAMEQHHPEVAVKALKGVLGREKMKPLDPATAVEAGDLLVEAGEARWAASLYRSLVVVGIQDADMRALIATKAEKAERIAADGGTPVSAPHP